VREGVVDGFSKCARWEMPLGGLWKNLAMRADGPASSRLAAASN
jgi:hypothetical protein